MGSTRIPKTENCVGGGSPEVVAVYRRRIGEGVASLTTFLRLKASVSLSRDHGESLA